MLRNNVGGAMAGNAHMVQLVHPVAEFEICGEKVELVKVTKFAPSKTVLT